MKLLIALPCFNEAETIEDVLRALPHTLAGIDAIRALVVDDGSADDTAAIAYRVGASVIRHKQNRGLGEAFRSATT